MTGTNRANADIDEDVFEPSEILVEHIGENDSETACEDNAGTMPAPAYQFSPTTQPSMDKPDSMPSVERRRRRRHVNKILLNNDISVDSEFIPINPRQAWTGNMWVKYDTAILGMLLLFTMQLFSVRDRIIQDIQRTRQEALANNRPTLFLPRYIGQIPRIATILLKYSINEEIVHYSKRMVSNPLQSPQLLYELLLATWDNLVDVLKQLHHFLVSLPILRTLFGTDVMIIGSEVISDAVPDLEEKSENVDADDDDFNDCAHASNGNNTVSVQSTSSSTSANSKSIIRKVRYDNAGLPPAFEREEDYPAGWIMYHPKFGVTTREHLVQQKVL